MTMMSEAFGNGSGTTFVVPPASNGTRAAPASSLSEQVPQGEAPNEAKYDDASTAAVGDDSEMSEACGPLSFEAVF